MRGVLENLGLKYYGRNFKLVKKFAKKNNIILPFGRNISQKKCSKCLEIKDISKFYKHKKVCKECFLSSTKVYRDKNKKALSQYAHDYYVEHKIKFRERKRMYMRNKRANNSLFSLQCTISRLIRESIKKNGYIKKEVTQSILGCTFLEFKTHIESKFEKWMTWKNKGKYNGKFNYGWDLDHIVPLKSAKTKEELIRLNHYTNFRPLCAMVNRHIKRDKRE